MKLWWPHSEAMIAFLMGYSDSGDPALLHLFYQVAEYTFRQVSAASWAIAHSGLSAGVVETTGSHSSPGRPQPGFLGLWEEARPRPRRLTPFFFSSLGMVPQLA